MKIIKNVSKQEMVKKLQEEAKVQYASCDEDCPRCRVSDG